MGYEVELKYRDADHPGLRARLQAMGVTAGVAVHQVDCYLSHPCRDFKVTGEALRIRRMGAENRVTYKGAKIGGPVKTREEFELGFEPGPEAFEALVQLWDRLGFKEVARVSKTRQPFHLERDGCRFEISLDVVESLGAFVEIETLVDSAEEIPAVQSRVVGLASALGLDPASVEPRSYLRMHLETRKESTSVERD